MKDFIEWVLDDPVRHAFAIAIALLILTAIVVILMPLPERTPICF